MLPSPVVSGTLEALLVKLRKVLRNNGKQADALYFGLPDARAVVFKRKRIPGTIAADKAKILIHSINHLSIPIVFRWPGKDHGNIFILFEAGRK
jgi:hypothetical protein